MDARCELRRIVAVLFGVGAWCLHVIADSVYTYGSDLNLQISAELDTSKGCRANAEERQGRKIVLISKKKQYLIVILSERKEAIRARKTILILKH